MNLNLAATADVHAQQQNVLSPLMKAKKKAGDDHKRVNACPFGCKTDDLDDRGYCHHLVGITLSDDFAKPESERRFEPVKMIRGRRVTIVKREQIRLDPETGGDEWKWGPPQYETVQGGDVQVQISTGYRVYRNVQVQKKTA